MILHQRRRHHDDDYRTQFTNTHMTLSPFLQIRKKKTKEKPLTISITLHRSIDWAQIETSQLKGTLWHQKKLKEDAHQDRQYLVGTVISQLSLRMHDCDRSNNSSS